jgi:hypothetical protein
MGATPRQSFAQHWDGSSWTTIATPNLGGSGANNEIFGVSTLEAGHAVGVGYGNFVVGSTPMEGEAWDLLASGTSTNAAESGPGAGDNSLGAVARSGAGVWAVGYGRNTASSAAKILVIPATWDGTTHTLTWSAVGASDSPSASGNFLSGVAAVSPYAFWAVGLDDTQTLTESYCARNFTMTGPPTSHANVAFSVTITVKNGDGTTATGYRGTVQFTSTDGTATLPANYAFLAGDNGAHTFGGVVLRTAGSQTITVADIAMPLTVPVSITVAVCVGLCQAPTGAPGSRNTNQGATGTKGGRTGANPSGAGAPGPRVRRLGVSSQSGGSAPPATTTGQATSVVAAATAVASTSAQSAAPSGGAVGDGPRSTSAQAPAQDVVSLMAQKAAAQPRDHAPWNVLLLIPLIACALALIAARRPRSKGMRR